MIKTGLSASQAKRIFADLAIGQGAGFKALNLSEATVNKKAKLDHTLSPGDSERVIGFARLVGQVESMIQESGDPTGFDATAWMARWLQQPVPALGGCPARRTDGHDGGPGSGFHFARADAKRGIRLSQIVWRIAADTPAYEADDLSGAGARHTGGRWNERGVPVVYAAETRSLACLETIVHLDSLGLPFNRYLVALTIPAAIWAKASRTSAGALPVGWDAQPAGRVSIAFGTAWLRSQRAAVLVVPSSIVPEEHTLLINPNHRDSALITAAKIRRWLYDPRLARQT